jgi:galacturan 1,4-alpha-galacturonidase
LLQTLLLDHATNSTVRGLYLVNSRGFHLNFRHSSRVVAEGLHIRAPAGSSNTDGIHAAHSSDVRILNSVIGTGDDCVSLGPGSTDVVVNGVVCGPGHGISVGSLGMREGEEEDVRGLVVRNCTLRGTTNGVRIKTWPSSPPGRASNITFEDITMADVSNPIIIDQQYCPHGQCNLGKPSLVQISDVMFRHIKGTSRTKAAVQLLCSSARPCAGVRLVGISLTCGNQTCTRVITNVQGTPPAPARLEEEADVTEQLVQ